MPLKQYSTLILSICVLLLGACNLPTGTPPTPTLSVDTMVQTQVAAIPTNTQPPAPAPTVAPILATPTLTLFYDPTITSILATPTLTLFYDPTITSTPSLMECPIIVTVTDTKAGDMLHIRRCEDNLEYDLGPFAKGMYAVGPNQKFIVYVTNNGFIYAAKIGSTYLTLVKNLTKEKKYTAVNKGVPPKFSISFMGEEPYYKIVLSEKRFGQKYLYDVPVSIVE